MHARMHMRHIGYRYRYHTWFPPPMRGSMHACFPGRLPSLPCAHAPAGLSHHPARRPLDHFPTGGPDHERFLNRRRLGGLSDHQGARGKRPTAPASEGRGRDRLPLLLQASRRDGLHCKRCGSRCLRMARLCSDNEDYEWTPDKAQSRDRTEEVANRMKL